MSRRTPEPPQRPDVSDLMRTERDGDGPAIGALIATAVLTLILAVAIIVGV